MHLKLIVQKVAVIGMLTTGVIAGNGSEVTDNVVVTTLQLSNNRRCLVMFQYAGQGVRFVVIRSGQGELEIPLHIDANNSAKIKESDGTWRGLADGVGHVFELNDNGDISYKRIIKLTRKNFEAYLRQVGVEPSITSIDAFVNAQGKKGA